MDDDDYDASASVTHTNQTTSSEWICRMSQVSDVKKALIRTAAPRGGRCVVSNIAEEGGVEFAHCIPRRLSWSDREMMGNLEWWWNMQKNTLNLDTRYNIFPLAPTLHRLFDKHEWLLLPEENIINHYHEKCRLGLTGWETERASISLQAGPIFLYTLVPLPFKMTAVWISRQNTIPAAGTPVQPNHVSNHYHPFNDLPALDSHLQPHFVIFKTGRKLITLPGVRLADVLVQVPLLNKILHIYEAWTKARPEDAEQKISYVPAPSDDGSDADDDGNTQPRRCVPSRSRPAPQSSPTPGRNKQSLGQQTKGDKVISENHGKRKRARHPACALSSENLHGCFEEEKMCTADSIRAWSDHNQLLADCSELDLL